MAVKLNASFPSYDKLGDNGSKSYTTLSCTYFQRSGHDEANCWTDHGYPNRWDSRSSRTGGRGTSRGGCGFSRNVQPNNEKRNNRNDVHASVAVVLSNLAAVSRNEASAHASQQSSLPNITSTQWQKLLELLGNSSL